MLTVYFNNQWEKLQELYTSQRQKTLGRVSGKALRTTFILIFALFMAAPVLSIMWKAVAGGNVGAVLWTHGTVIAFRNTLLLGLLVSLTSAVIAYGLAWALTVSGLADKPLARVLCMVPFMGAPYLTSIGWILFMEPNGYLVHLAPFMSGLGPKFFSLWGLVCVMSLHLFPIPFVSALQSISIIQEKYEAPAKAHGASMSLRLLRIWIPLSIPGVVGSSLLVFVKTIGEFGTPLVFGSLLHFPVLTTTIYLHMTNWPIDFHAAAELSTLLLGTVLFVWVMNDAYQRRTQLTMEGAASLPNRRRLLVRAVGFAFMFIVGVVSIAIPLGSLLVTSLLTVEGDGVHLANMSFIHYQHVFQIGNGAMTAIGTTMELGVFAATLVLAMSVALVVLSRFYRSPTVKVTEWLGLLPNAIPDILLVIGLILFWNARWWPVTPYNTQGILVVGYSVVLFPFAYTYLREALFRLSPTVWEAAMAHQASRLRIAFRIVAPLMATAMASGWMMVFAVVLRDLVVPMLLSPPNTTVVATYIYGQFDQGSLPDAMALAVLTLILTITLLTLVEWMNHRTLRRV